MDVGADMGLAWFSMAVFAAIPLIFAVCFSNLVVGHLSVLVRVYLALSDWLSLIVVLFVYLALSE